MHQDEIGRDRMASRRKRLVRKMLWRRRQTTRFSHGVTEKSQRAQNEDNRKAESRDGVR